MKGDSEKAIVLGNILSDRENRTLPSNLAKEISAVKKDEISTIRRLNTTTDDPSPIYYTERSSSTMDLAFFLSVQGKFPEGSSVLSGQQENGRGQFKRNWVSPLGNLYASIRLNDEKEGFPLIPFVLSLSVQRALSGLGLFSEFKWPNDILVGRKKVGGILVEEREGVTVAGIGINLVSAPSIPELRDPRALPSGCLLEFGVTLSPLELWQVLLKSIKDHFARFSDRSSRLTLIRELEKSLAFIGETGVVTAPQGDEFPAVIEGLSESGGIRVKTQEGEKTLFSGSFFPVVR